MAVDPVQNVINEIKDLKRRIKVLETSPSQQNMTVDKGATRILSDEGLQVGEPGSDTGSEIVYGVLTIVGTLNGDGTINWEGTLNQVGPTNLRGPVAITGENGTLTVDAETLLRALTRVLADLQVEAGGKIVVQGSQPIQLRQVGGIARIDLGATAGIWSGGDGVTIAATAPGGFMNVYSGGVDIDGGLGRPGIHLDDTGINIGIPPTGAGSFIGVDANGYLVRVSGGTGGGPGDGVFAWPFSLDLVTSEFRSAERPGHDGIDFGSGIAGIEGTSIPAAGAGIVETVGVPGTGHGWGYYVVVNHGTDPLYGGAEIKTRYAHMYQMPAVSVGDPVALGMTLGGIGDTGNSFGEHLHYEVLVDGDWVNPRTFHAAHGG